ncbi:hypothetical protein [Schlesneria paludicola]|uniref:hypothetical protein n=1 Tax=Schlesneria paludicola TaxID=360056 RepID=UPI0012F951B7|nr:hypothetical protein [Schlesneria paludicola]
MPKVTNSLKSITQNPASRMAFAVAICALSAAGLGAIINHWMTGWMAVGGMVGVGLFYLAIGILNLGRGEPDNEGDASLNISQRHASAENLYGEQIARPQLNVVPQSGPDQNPSKDG